MFLIFCYITATITILVLNKGGGIAFVEFTLNKFPFLNVLISKLIQTQFLPLDDEQKEIIYILFFKIRFLTIKKNQIFTNNFGKFYF